MFVFAYVSLPSLKTSQAGFNRLESGLVQSCCMTEEFKDENNYKSILSGSGPPVSDAVQNHSSLGLLSYIM